MWLDRIEDWRQMLLRIQDSFHLSSEHSGFQEIKLHSQVNTKPELEISL